jgi:hypothetical protein
MHTDQLRALVAAVQRDGNRTLDALARQQPAPPAGDFHRPYALTLAGVELALHGYCVPRGGGRVTFRLGRPPLWRRWLLPAPLLVLRFSAHGGSVAVSVGAARAGAGSASGQPRSIHLDPVLQDALLRLHRDHLPHRTFLQKVAGWRT